MIGLCSLENSENAVNINAILVVNNADMSQQGLLFEITRFTQSEMQATVRAFILLDRGKDAKLKEVIVSETISYDCGSISTFSMKLPSGKFWVCITLNHQPSVFGPAVCICFNARREGNPRKICKVNAKPVEGGGYSGYLNERKAVLLPFAILEQLTGINRDAVRARML